MMRSAVTIATLVTLFGAFLPGSRPVKAEPAEGSTRQQILVLRNGQIFEGRITQANGLYLVNFTDGQIRIKAADVELVCDSLEDGYRKKRATIQQGNVHHHLELAQWCLRHRLFESAAAELADAAAIDSTNPMIGALQNRLDIMTEPATERPSPATRTAIGPSNEELDRMIRGLPREAVEMFSQSVQPMLMNHCATSGCHGPASDDGLQLFRVAAGKSVSRRITQRNLYSALAYVDRENPVASRLLAASCGPHGTVKHAVFSEHEAAQFRRLVAWVGLLAEQPMSDVPATLPSALPLASPQIPPQTLSQDAQRARPMPGLHRGATGDSPHGQADPFDPEAFNRRHATTKPASADKGETP